MKAAYGQRTAPKLWYFHFSKLFHDRGFVSLDLDPCVFIHSTKARLDTDTDDTGTDMSCLVVDGVVVLQWMTS